MYFESANEILIIPLKEQTESFPIMLALRRRHYTDDDGKISEIESVTHPNGDNYDDVQWVHKMAWKQAHPNVLSSR